MPLDDGAAQSNAPGQGPQATRGVKIGIDFRAKRLDTPLDRLTRRAAGKRSVTLTSRKRGRYVRARPVVGKPEDLAFDATLRTAAPFQPRRRAEREDKHLAFPASLVIRSSWFDRRWLITVCPSQMARNVGISRALSASEAGRLHVVLGARPEHECCFFPHTVV